MRAADPASAPTPATGLPRLFGDRRGMALVEFGLTFPILILAMTGAYEMSLAATAGRELTRLANSAATMLTVNTTGTINYLNLHYANDIAMLIFPDVLKDSAFKGVAWGSDISISMAGVGFSPTVAGCTSACTYQANIYWTGDRLSGLAARIRCPPPTRRRPARRRCPTISSRPWRRPRAAMRRPIS